MSFDEALSTDTDKARFFLGDTDTDNELLSDFQIESVLALYTPLATGIAVLAEGLVSKFAQKPTSVSASGKSIAWAERVKAWRDLAARLRATGSLTGVASAFSVAMVRSDGYSEAADA